MSFENMVVQLAQKGTKSFWYDLAQSAWIQSSKGNETQSRLFAEAYTMGAMAASILDDVQDQDGENALWQSTGTGPAIAIGVGLSFKTINALNLVGLVPVQYQRLVLHYARTVEQMCQGQYRDLADVTTPLTLTDAWTIVEDKTGAWCAFGVSAYAEAVGSKDSDAMKTIGRHIGCWHQLGNDLMSILVDDGKGDLPNRKHTLLSSYAFTVAQGSDRIALEDAWNNSLSSIDVLREVLIDLGVREYANAMSDYHLTQANIIATQVGITLPIPKVASPFVHYWAPTGKPAEL